MLTKLKYNTLNSSDLRDALTAAFGAGGPKAAWELHHHADQLTLHLPHGTLFIKEGGTLHIKKTSVLVEVAL